MYGDTTAIRTRAAELRTAAREARRQASVLRADAAQMTWESAAADVLRGRVSRALDAYLRLAEDADGAADKLTQHANQVDATKSAIHRTEAAIRAAVEEARSLVGRVVEVTEEVSSGAVSTLMRVVRTVTNAASDLVEVSVFKIGGQIIAREVVERARHITMAVPQLPAPGSLDWLDLHKRFSSMGWW